MPLPCHSNQSRNSVGSSEERNVGREMHGESETTEETVPDRELHFSSSWGIKEIGSPTMKINSWTVF